MISKDVKGILINLCVNCLAENNGKIGKSFRVFKSCTKNLSLKQKKHILAISERRYIDLENESIRIKKEREDFNKLLQAAKESLC